MIEKRGDCFAMTFSAANAAGPSTPLRFAQDDDPVFDTNFRNRTLVPYQLRKPCVGIQGNTFLFGRIASLLATLSPIFRSCYCLLRWFLLIVLLVILLAE